MAEISLRDVTTENWRQVCALEVAEDQKSLIAPNWYSLLQAVYGFSGELSFLHLVPLAVYAAEQPVGLVMYNAGPAEEHFFIMRIMIDQHEQGQGYGRAALELLITRLKQRPQAREVAISYVPGNRVAEHLYRALGFEEIGPDGDAAHAEMVAVLDLNQQTEPWQSLWRE